MPAPPLYSAASAAAPPRAEAAWLRTADGMTLRTALFAAAAPRGSVVLNTGRTEFIEKYYEVIGEFVGRGFTVLTHDWRGQGLSTRLLTDPLKGHAAGAGPFLDDLDAILARYQDRLPRPWIVAGHSMGGALTLLHLLQRPGRFQAAMLSSPMTGVNLHGNNPALVKLSIFGRRLIGRLGDYVEAPTAQPWDDQFAGNSVTHDTDRFQRTVGLLQAHHDLALGAPTWGWLAFALDAAAAIQSSAAAPRLGIPLSVIAAGEESLADTPATQAFCARVPGARCAVAPGARHEILMEQDPTRALYWAAFDAMAAQLPAV